MQFFGFMISLGVAYADLPKDFVWETGDVIGHTSTSRQSKAIQIGTMSKYSHVGVVVYKDGVHKVLEARSRVKYTPISVFLKRGKGKKYTVLRPKKPLTSTQQKQLRAVAKNYIGKPYDTPFQWSDKKMYCSEVIWKMYDDIGIEIAPLQELKDYYFHVPKIKKEVQRRWNGKVNWKEPTIAPSDIMKSSYFRVVHKEGYWLR